MNSFWIIPLAIALLLPFLSLEPVAGQSPAILRSTFSIGGPAKANHATPNEFSIQQSVGQSSAIGIVQRGNISLRQGFLQPVWPRLDGGLEASTLKAKIYPNPFSSDVSISIEELIDDPLIIHVHDLMGRVLFTKTSEQDTPIVIGLSSIPSALYVIKVQSGGRVYVARIRKIDP